MAFHTSNGSMYVFHCPLLQLCKSHAILLCLVYIRRLRLQHTRSGQLTAWLRFYIILVKCPATASDRELQDGIRRLSKFKFLIHLASRYIYRASAKKNLLD